MGEKKPQLFEYVDGKLRWVSGAAPPDPQADLHKRQEENARKIGDPGWAPNAGYAQTPQKNNQLWDWDKKEEKRGV